MIVAAPGTKVYPACQPVSMRLGLDGLAARVSQVRHADPFMKRYRQICAIRRTLSDQGIA
jgi:hypothetical protein